MGNSEYTKETSQLRGSILPPQTAYGVVRIALPLNARYEITQLVTSITTKRGKMEKREDRDKENKGRKWRQILVHWPIQAVDFRTDLPPACKPGKVTIFPEIS